MTISSTSSRVVYAGNGSTTVFPFAFKVQQAADLVVIYTDATGTNFTLSPSQYTASGFGLDAGGAVTYPAGGSATPIASGTALTIQRLVAPTQPTSINNQGAMWPQVIEAALDRIVTIAQGFLDTAARALAAPPTDGTAINALPTATQRANAYLAFDGNGQPIAAQSLGTATVSSWLASNFLAAASRLAALGALGGAGTADNNTLTGSNDFTGGRIKVPTRPGGDNGADAANTAFVRGFALRSYLAGLTLSAAGGTATFGVAAGCAADSTNLSMMSLATAWTKTTAAWAAGSGAGALDIGTIANGSWYHAHLIQRPDTGATDVLVSLSATAPTLPASYTLFRRVGAMKTDGAGKWVGFLQQGNRFTWMVPVNDVSASQGPTPNNYSLSVPSGVVVYATFRAMIVYGANVSMAFYSPDQNTQTVGTQGTAPVPSITVITGTGGNSGNNQQTIRTNASSQIAAVGSNNGISLYITTESWRDERGEHN